VLHEIYRRMARRHNITVLTSNVTSFGQRTGQQAPHTEYMDGIKVVRIKTRQVRIPFSPLPLQLFPAMQSHIQSVNAELYHINNRYQYFPGTIDTIKRNGAKLAITIHNSLPIGISAADDGFGLLYDIVAGRRFIHAADAITAVSKDAMESTVPSEDRRRARVIYNGVDWRVFRKMSGRDVHVRSLKEKLGRGSTLILSTGRLTRQKGQVYLMEAVAGLIRKGRDVRLLIIGRGPMYSQLYRYASRLGMADRFEITSGIPENELPYYYNAADMFALTSLYEPAGMALLEAMACGVPSVVSRIGGMPEMAMDSAMYAKPRDPQSISGAMEAYLSDKKMAGKKAARGISLVAKRNDWDSISKEYEDYFLSVSSR